MYHLKGMLIYESWEAEVWLLKKVALWTPGLLNSPAFWGRPWAFQERAFPRREAVCLGVQNKHLRAWERISAAIVDKPTTLRLTASFWVLVRFCLWTWSKVFAFFHVTKRTGRYGEGLAFADLKPFIFLCSRFVWFSESVQSHGHFCTVSYLWWDARCYKILSFLKGQDWF